MTPKESLTRIRLYLFTLKSIGFLMVSQLEHMPHKGESLVVNDLKFEVIKADNRRVYLIKLKKLK
jgi:magnesium and cobalt transporter